MSIVSTARQTVWILSFGERNEGERVVKIWGRKPSDEEVLAVLPRREWVKQIDAWIYDGDWADLDETEVAS